MEPESYLRVLRQKRSQRGRVAGVICPMRVRYAKLRFDFAGLWQQTRFQSLTFLL